MTQIGQLSTLGNDLVQKPSAIRNSESRIGRHGENDDADVARTYTWDHREVAEALTAQLRAKDIPAPLYVANTNDTKWTIGSSGVTVEWTDADQVEVY